MDPIATARYGMMTATRRFEASANQIASMGSEAQAGGGVDLAHEMVEMVQAKHQFTANVQVVRFAQEMWDSLLKLQSR